MYAPDVEGQMKTLYELLSECDRRRYAGMEASKLGHGGTQYIARVLGCDAKTIRRGQAELRSPQDRPVERVLKKGGAVSAILIARRRCMRTSWRCSENTPLVIRNGKKSAGPT